jgi:hypothetical protein
MDPSNHANFAGNLPETLLVDPQVGDEAAGFQINDDMIQIPAREGSPHPPIRPNLGVLLLQPA